MLPGEAAGAPCRQQSQAQPPGARRDQRHRPGPPAAPAPSPGGTTAPSSGHSENGCTGPRKQVQDSQPHRLWGRVWSKVWACQAVTPGPQAGACRWTPAVQAHHTTLGWPGAGCPGRCSGGSFCNPRPTLSSSNLLQVIKDCFPRRVGPEQRGDLMGSRHTLRGCADTHNRNESGSWLQACAAGHSVHVPREWAWVMAHSLQGPQTRTCLSWVVVPDCGVRPRTDSDPPKQLMGERKRAHALHLRTAAGTQHRKMTNPQNPNQENTF